MTMTRFPTLLVLPATLWQSRPGNGDGWSGEQGSNEQAKASMSQHCSCSPPLGTSQCGPPVEPGPRLAPPHPGGGRTLAPRSAEWSYSQLNFDCSVTYIGPA